MFLLIVRVLPVEKMMLSRLSAKYRLPSGVMLLLLSACGAKQPTVPNHVEAIAHSCYKSLLAPGRTPELSPSEPMEDGKLLILWSIVEFPDEQGSCTVDGTGRVLLLTSNTDRLSPSQTAEPAPTD